MVQRKLDKMVHDVCLAQYWAGFYFVFQLSGCCVIIFSVITYLWRVVLMKVKRMFVYITLIVLVASLIGVIFLQHISMFHEISLGILSGSIVGLVMTLAEYFVERRKAMWNFYQAGCKMERVLSFGEYGAHSLMHNAPLDLIFDCVGYNRRKFSASEREEIIKCGGHNVKDIEDFLDTRFIDDGLEYYVANIRKELVETLNFCLKVSEELEGCGLEDAYENLAFFWGDRSKKHLHQKEIYNIYNKAMDKFRLSSLRRYVQYPKSYSNLQSWSKLIKDLNEYFFSQKTNDIGNAYYSDYDEIIRDELNEHLQKFRKRMNWVKEK